jgi:ATP-dependent helicase/nuclease subunit A
VGARLPDEDARERVRAQLERNFLVEAGAGTGKTRLLIDRVERFIASGTARLRNIVAITFTEAAAAELRVEIRKRIEKRLHSAPDGAPAMADEVRERFLIARQDLEIASVSTIHAFCADLLRERPVEARVDPAFRVADDLAASLLRARAWDDWMDAQKDAAPEALRRAIEFGVSLDQLRLVGDELLRYRDVVTGDVDPGPEPPDPVEWLRGAEGQIRSCIARIGGECRNHDDRAVEDLRDVERRLDTLAHLAPAEMRRAVLSNLKVKVGGRQENWAPGALRTIKRQLDALHDDLVSLRQAHAHQLAAGALDWLRGYAQAYRALKARQGVVDFDDLLLLSRDLLRDRPDVRGDFQRRFDAILVDEFQDTDPLQAEIIFFLAEDGPRASSWDQVKLKPGRLFIVGDPKQSIYAFRRADIETYEQAKAAFERTHDTERIVANFRSVREILDAVNATFENVMRAPDNGAYQPDYDAIEPFTGTRSAGDSPALVLLYPDPAPPTDADVAELRQAEAEALAAYLRRSVDAKVWQVVQGTGARRPARYGDIALLFRGLADVQTYEGALARYDVPYRVTSSRTFYVREEVGWLVNVLHAVEHPTDAVAVWGAMRSPLLGCSDREIYEFAAGGGTFDYRQRTGPAGGGARPGVPASIAAAFDVLRGLHHARNEWSVPQLVEEVLARTSARITFLLTPQGEQRVANLNKIVTMARALEESGLLSLRGFVRWLRDMEDQAVEEAEQPTVEEGDNVVRIMSIHAAKGLEFPIVVVPDLGRGPGGRARPILVHRVQGTSAVRIGKSGREFSIQTRDYEALYAYEEQREAAERLRLLYVAMTRARDALVLPVFPKPSRGGFKGSLMADLEHIIPATPRFGQTHRGWLMVDGSQVPRVDRDPPPLRVSLPDAPVASGPGVADREAWLQARERLLTGASPADEVVHPSAMVDQDAVAALKRQGVRLETERGGRRLGDLVHAVLAVVPLDRPDLAADFARYFGRRRRLSDALMARAAALVRAALASAAIQGARAGRFWREVPFTVGAAAGVVEGAIDLLGDARGQITVADFKTDAPGDETARAALSALYEPQLQAYADAVTRAGVQRIATALLFLRDAEAGPSRRPTSG